MTTHSPWSPFLGPSLHFVFLLYFYNTLRVLAYPLDVQIVTTIENTDPRISYLPSVCNSTGSTASSTCGDLIPQLFLVLRGTSFVLTTSPVSNATANVTILASPSNVFVSTTFNSSAGSISTVGLPSDQDVTLALTFIVSPNGVATRLDIDSVVVFGASDQRYDQVIATCARCY